MSFFDLQSMGGAKHARLMKGSPEAKAKMAHLRALKTARGGYPVGGIAVGGYPVGGGIATRGGMPVGGRRRAAAVGGRAQHMLGLAQHIDRNMGDGSGTAMLQGSGFFGDFADGFKQAFNTVAPYAGTAASIASHFL